MIENLDEYWKETAIEKQLSALEERRVQLCAKLPNAEGWQKQSLGAKLTQVNAELKRLHKVSSERNHARALWLAARNILSDEDFLTFMDEARAIRIHGKGLRNG